MKKRIAFWTILCALAALVVWWVQFFPYDEDRLLGAVPPDAVFVSLHDRLDERWPNIFDTPAVRRTLLAAGVDVEDLDRLRRDPDVLDAVRRFASKKTVVAYVPSGARGVSGWVIGTWRGR